MPGIVQVKVVSARDLPIMDRSSELTDAFVELKLGQVFYRTEVCPKTLNPSWDSQWFKFNVDDEEIQDEPLQIKLMDYDTYSAHDAIGKVYICLNPLVDSSSATTTMMEGWFPIFDTLHGVRGEVRVKVKLEMIMDHHRFKQSSCGVRFFACPQVPSGYTVETIHGFVEELVVNDDPEYQWIDKIRTPRSSNEARQRLFSKLSGELQRKVGLKALEAGGNAVIGYRQCFDLEGESGIVVRGIGTCVGLIPSHLSTIPIPIQLPFSTQHGIRTHTDKLPEESSTLLDPLTSPKHLLIHRHSSSDHDSDGAPASPIKSSGAEAQSSAPVAGSGGLHLTPIATAPPALKHVTSLLEFPFYTLTTMPPGTLKHIGGIVSARSVKLLDKINNPEEPETRDAWWQEVRNEVRSHARAMGCNAVIGYSESTSICDTLCVYSASGTAVCMRSSNVAPLSGRKLQTSSGSSSELRVDAEGADGSGEVKEGGMEGPPGPKDILDFPNCGACHTPYSVNKPPFEIKLSHCAVCRSRLVPSVILSTGELPPGLSVRGKGCLVQARVCHFKRKIKGDENAFQVSKQLPFLEYKLHSRLLTKLHVKGMNAAFGVKFEVTVGDTMVTGVATGTGVFLEALPPPSRLSIGDRETPRDSQQLAEIQVALNKTQDENRKKYELDQPLDMSGVIGELDTSGEEDGLIDLNLSTGKKEVYVIDVDEVVLTDEDLLEITMDNSLPAGFHASNLSTVPGVPPNTLSGDSRMVATVTKKVLDGARQHLEKQFAQLFDKILQALAFKARRLHPCVLSHVRFDVDLPEEDEVQIAATAMATRLEEPDNILQLKKHQSEEMIFPMEETVRGRSPISTGTTQPNTASHKDLRKGDGGLDAFMHTFLLEAHAIARAHVVALGGNAFLSYRLNECVLIEHLHKNQAQCLFNLSGDAVTLKCSDVQVSRTGSPEQPMNTMQLLELPTSDAAPVQANTSSGGAKETLLYRVTEL